jgi:hypothetical protein
MRASTRWLVGISMVLLAAAIAMAGCGSGGGGGTRDAGPDTLPVTTGSGGASGAGGGSGTDAAAVCTPLGGSVATIAAGATWACFQAACMTELVACAADCTCNNAMLNALLCVSTTGDSRSCFTTAAVTGGSGAVSVAICLEQGGGGGGGDAAACSAPTPDGGGTDGP